jgi:hypothetical protein
MTMTDAAPEPYNPEDPGKAERLGGRIGFEAAYTPPRYPGSRHGAGRWFRLAAHGEDLGYMWTNDVDAIGFIPTTTAGIVRQPEFVHALSRAAGHGTPVQEVFDHWAGYASLGLQAGQVVNGDLDTLDDV